MFQMMWLCLYCSVIVSALKESDQLSEHLLAFVCPHFCSLWTCYFVNLFPRLQVYPLHSSVTLEEQNNVFLSPVPGYRKVGNREGTCEHFRHIFRRDCAVAERGHLR